MSMFSFLTNPYQQAGKTATAGNFQAQKFLQQQLQDQLAMQMPYIQQGQQAFGLYQALTGARGTDAQQQALQNFQMSPQAQFGLEQALRGINQNAAAQGNLFGGNRMRDLSATRTQAFQGDLASYIERLRAQAALGQQAANAYGGVGSALGSGIASTYKGIGDAQANAQLGGAQAIGQFVGGISGLAGSIFSGLGGAA